ncbi:MAG TPA: hypothetical protein PKA02_01085 [Candidatus Saccharibacteria bacterium]|nr:hypothetical protein [Candidatus Saccharibacteria bacterium]
MNPTQDQNTNQPSPDPTVVDAGMPPASMPTDSQVVTPLGAADPTTIPSMSSDSPVVDVPAAGTTVAPSESTVPADEPVVAEDSLGAVPAEAPVVEQEGAVSPPDDQPVEPEAPQTNGSF